MTYMKKTIGVLTIAALALTAPAFAGDEKVLTIGDAAPAISVDHWIKGEAVSKFEKDQVYIVEFWATWCGPCIAGIPHLTEVQERYRDYDVTTLSISSEKKLQTVVGFLSKKDDDGKTWSEKMGYIIGVDPDRSMSNSFMKPAGRNGIPCAFIVGKDSKIEWIGHPMRMDDPLRKIVDGEWDRDAFRTTYETNRKAEDARNKMRNELRDARKDGDWEAVARVLDGVLEASPDDRNALVEKFNLLLMELDRPEEGYAIGARIAELSWDEAPTLNMLAWTVADNPKVGTRNLDFALKAASRAVELTDSKDGAILDTLARVHYERGDLKKAVHFQELAVEFAPEGAMKDDLKKALKKYQSKLGG